MSKLICGIMLAAACLWGQAVTSTITGRVKDPSGSAIPGAKVAVVSQDSGIRYDSASNELGLYRVGSLSPGTYRVEVDALGFQLKFKRIVTALGFADSDRVAIMRQNFAGRPRAVSDHTFPPTNLIDAP